MLTGLIRPSAGECFVMGHSLAAAPAAARAHIGYCPQSNVLFDALTPREHLALFGAVKGLASRAERAEAAASMLKVRAPVCGMRMCPAGSACRCQAHYCRSEALNSLC